MDDSSTTVLIRKRILHWKTSLAGVASMLCPVVAIFLPPEWGAKVLSASALLSGAALLAANDPTKETVQTVVKTGGGKLPLPLLAAILCVGAAAMLLCGCSTFKSLQRETAPDGTVRETEIKARTFMDAKSDLAKLRASTTDKTQGMTIGALGQESSGSNAVSLAEALMRGAVSGAVQGAAAVAGAPPVKP